MPDHDSPPPAAAGADQLVDGMKLFLRGGPVPVPTTDNSVEPPDQTRTFDHAAATADPGEWTPSPAGLDTTPGQEIGPYRVIRFATHGGMGAVYYARHRDLPREVALKMIRAPFAAEPALRERFKVEAKAAERLDHPNVVKLYDLGEHDGELYIAMEWAPGGDLSKRLAAGPLPPREAAVLVRSLADAMAYAHGRGVLHRDLKPKNVLLTADGTPKVADFGLARVRTGDESGGLTQSGAVLGTPAYMAPEQAVGKDVDVRTDVYALGAILYEVLTAEPPFAGDSKDAVLKQVRESDPPRPSSLTPGLPTDLEVICLRCLSKHAADRYQTAGELVVDLDRFLAGEPLAPGPWLRVRRAARAVRKRWRPVAVVALLVATASGTVLLTPRPETDETRRAAQWKALTAKLDGGGEVVLIPTSGLPTYGSELLAGNDRTQLATADDGPCVVNSWTECMVGLVRDPRHAAFRFRAKVRHVRSDIQGSVGLFVCDREFPGPTGGKNAWAIYLTFNDHYGPAVAAQAMAPPEVAARLIVQASAQPNRALLYLAGRGDQAAGVPWDARASLGAGATYIPQGVNAGWHDLDFRVTADGVSATMDSTPVGSATPEAVRQQTRRLLDATARRDPHPCWTNADANPIPRGAVGLYVHNGAAAFRDVVIEPLNPTP